VQRHRLPSSARSMTASVGACPRALHAASAAWQATVMPGVQKPHCEPWKPASRSARRPGRHTPLASSMEPALHTARVQQELCALLEPGWVSKSEHNQGVIYSGQGHDPVGTVAACI